MYIYICAFKYMVCSSIWYKTIWSSCLLYPLLTFNVAGDPRTAPPPASLTTRSAISGASKGPTTNMNPMSWVMLGHVGSCWVQILKSPIWGLCWHVLIGVDSSCIVFEPEAPSCTKRLLPQRFGLEIYLDHMPFCRMATNRCRVPRSEASPPLNIPW